MTAKLYKKIYRNYQAGELVFREGDSCDGLYSIKSGLVSIYKTLPAEVGSVQVELARLGPGAMFGEMGVFQPEGKRDASVKALEYTEILVITRQMLDAQFANLPVWASNFFRILIERLQMTNERLLQATAKLQAAGADPLLPTPPEIGGPAPARPDG